MNRVVHFEIQADNIERAKTFYEKVLGWKITQAMKKEDGFMDYWMIVTGEKGVGINGGLYQRPEQEDGKFYLYDCTIDVQDLDKAVEAVKTNGGTITKEKVELPGVGWFAAAKDTEGNKFGLMQPTNWKSE
jgi:predicted enzyme related to lactoylglutathione lyase